MKAGGKPGRVSRLDAVFALSGVAALMIVGPLRGLFEGYPSVLYLSTILLFMLPGLLVCHWFLKDHFSGGAAVPVAFAISSSIFGLLGVPLLMAHSTLGVYLALCGVVLVGFLLAAAVRARPRAPFKRAGEAVLAGREFSVLWIPFLLMCVALAYVSWTKVPNMYDDIWIYLSNVREFTSTEHLALYDPYFGDDTGISRVAINGWLLEQSAIVRVSGIDTIDLVLRYLAPTLVVFGLLAFYALARVLLESETAALFAASVCALFFLVNLSDSLLTFGGEFVARIAEDKFAARYIFLPVALAFAAAFLKEGRARYLWLFTLICWAMMAVHPVGLAVTGLSMAGFGLMYVAVNWRERAAWAKISGLGLAGLSAIAIPAALAYLLTGEPLTAVLKEADINSNDPDVLANMVFVRPERQRILELDDGFYIMHPSLLLDPVVLGSILLGFPFLIRRLKESLAAQMLLGILLLVTIVCYVPQVATFMGNNVVVPGQLWRLAWPIPLAAVLTAGWMAWETTSRLAAGIGRLGAPAVVLRFIPLLVICIVMWAVTPAIVAGANMVDRSEETAMNPRSCFDPMFRWMQRNIDEPSVVLAPDGENTCIPAYSAATDVVSVRGALVLNSLPGLEERVPGEIQIPQGAVDVQRFFSGATLQEGLMILDRYDVDYVLVRKGSALNAQLSTLPGFERLETAGRRYDLYHVDRSELLSPTTSS